MRKSFFVLLSGASLLSSCVTPQKSGDSIVRELLAQAVAGQQQWLSGSSRLAAERMAQAPTFSIFGPFGGPSPAGWSEESAKAQAATARLFQGGTTDIQLVQSYVSDDLIVLVTIERNRVRFAGHDGMHNWDLRTTQVYQREGTAWKVVHRHADPLIKFRNLEETIPLLSADGR